MLAIMPFSTGYQILGLLHILAAVVAFGTVFAYPSLHRAGATAELAKIHMRVVFPALFMLWVFGMGMSGLSKPEGADEIVFKVSQTWIVLAIIVWLILMLVSWFLIKPAIDDTSENGRKKLAMGTGIVHLGLVVGLVLMIWQPGGPF